MMYMDNKVYRGILTNGVYSFWEKKKEKRRSGVTLSMSMAKRPTTLFVPCFNQTKLWSMHVIHIEDGQIIIRLLMGTISSLIA